MLTVLANMFTKLFSSIIYSSIWQEEDPIRLVWITLLALADSRGYVFASVPGLAAAARVPVEDLVLALEKFTAPDALSSSDEYQGRRIEKVDGGWRLLNYEKYRSMRSSEARREQNREAQRRYRAKLKPKPGNSTAAERLAEKLHRDDKPAEADRVMELAAGISGSPADAAATIDQKAAEPQQSAQESTQSGHPASSETSIRDQVMAAIAAAQQSNSHADHTDPPLGPSGESAAPPDQPPSPTVSSSDLRQHSLPQPEI